MGALLFLLLVLPAAAWSATEEPLCPPAASTQAARPIPWGAEGHAGAGEHPHAWRYLRESVPDIAGAWDAVAPADQRRLLKAAAVLAEERRLKVLSDAVGYSFHLSPADSDDLSVWAGPEFAAEDHRAKKPFVASAGEWDEARARRLHEAWREKPAGGVDAAAVAGRVQAFPLLDEESAAFDRLWWQAASAELGGAATGARLLAACQDARPAFILGSAISTPASSHYGARLVSIRAPDLCAELKLRHPDRSWPEEPAVLRNHLAAYPRTLERLPPGWAVLTGHELIHHCIDRGFPIDDAILSRGTRSEERYAQTVAIRLLIEALLVEPDMLDAQAPFAIILRRNLRQYLEDRDAFFAKLRRDADADWVKRSYLQVLGKKLSPEQRRSRDRALKTFAEEQRFLERARAAHQSWIERHRADALAALAGADAANIRGPYAGFDLYRKLDALEKLGQGDLRASRSLLERSVLKTIRHFIVQMSGSLEGPEGDGEAVRWVRPVQNILARLGLPEPRALTELAAAVYVPDEGPAIEGGGPAPALKRRREAALPRP